MILKCHFQLIRCAKICQVGPLLSRRVADCKQELHQYFEYCRNLRFPEKPDYNKLRYLRSLNTCSSIFSDLFKRKKYIQDGVFDWTPLLVCDRRRSLQDESRRSTTKPKSTVSKVPEPLLLPPQNSDTPAKQPTQTYSPTSLQKSQAKRRRHKLLEKPRPNLAGTVTKRAKLIVECPTEAKMPPPAAVQDVSAIVSPSLPARSPVPMSSMTVSSIYPSGNTKFIPPEYSIYLSSKTKVTPAPSASAIVPAIIPNSITTPLKYTLQH